MKYWDVNNVFDERSSANGWPVKQTVYKFVGTFCDFDVWVDEKYQQSYDPMFVVVRSDDRDDYNAGSLDAFSWPVQNDPNDGHQSVWEAMTILCLKTKRLSRHNIKHLNEVVPDWKAKADSRFLNIWDRIVRVCKRLCGNYC